MKHLQTFEGFVKNYGDKMTPEEFAKLPVGAEVLFKGAKHTVEENNDGATIVLKPVKGGSPVMVNLNQFIQGGAIVESFDGFLTEGHTVNSMVDEIKNGIGWATPDYILQVPLNRPGRIALAIKLAEMGILFDEDDISDDPNTNPLEDKKIKPMSVEDVKKAII